MWFLLVYTSEWQSHKVYIYLALVSLFKHFKVAAPIYIHQQYIIECQLLHILIKDNTYPNWVLSVLMF